MKFLLLRRKPRYRSQANKELYLARDEGREIFLGAQEGTIFLPIVSHCTPEKLKF
jgi:hypothetical protein